MRVAAYGVLRTACCVLLVMRGAHAQTSNRIVAVVNDDVITEGDVASHMSVLLQQDEESQQAEASGEMRRAILERLIEERLILQEAKRMELSVGSDEVMDRLHQLRARLETEEAYRQMLQEAGLAEEQLKSKLRQQVLVQKAIDREVRSKIVVSPSEIATAAGSSSSAVVTPGEEVRVAHLLIRVNEARSAEQALSLANQVSERFRHGETFEDLTRKYSDGPEAQEGGLLGWVQHGQLLPELDQALSRLQPGEVSAPIQTRLGFHLLKVFERRSLSATQAIESRRRLEQRVYQQKFTQAVSQWLSRLKQRAYIRIVND